MWTGSREELSVTEYVLEHFVDHIMTSFFEPLWKKFHQILVLLRDAVLLDFIFISIYTINLASDQFSLFALTGRKLRAKYS